MAEKIADATGCSMTYVVGQPGSGKTQEIANRVSELLAGGVAPADIRIVVSGETAKYDMLSRIQSSRTRLVALPVISLVEFMSDVCAGLPVALNPVEKSFVLDDLRNRLPQTNPADIRKAVAGAVASWRRGKAPAGDEVASTLQSLLDVYGACFEEQLPLLANEHRASVPFVFVDDIDRYSPAQIAWLQRSCSNAFVASLESAIDAPSSAQLVALSESHLARGVTDIVAAASTAAQTASKTTSTNHEGVTVVKWMSFDEELEGISAYIQRYLAHHEGSLRPERVCVVAPNRQWIPRIAKALYRRYLNSTAAVGGISLSNDPRSLQKSQGLLAYAKLCLLAEPNRLMSWRLWCGVGRQDLAARSWSDLVLDGQQFDYAKPVSSPDDTLNARIVEGRKFIETYNGLRGFSLMRAVGIDKLPEFFRSLEEVAAQDDAPTLLKRVRKLVAEPVFADDPQSVRICTLNAIEGTCFDLVCLVGCNDGFVPPAAYFDSSKPQAARDTLLESARAQFRAAAGKARDELVVSYTTKAPAEFAQQLALKIARTKVESGESMAMLRPSCLLSELADACPGTLSGDAFLARQV